MTTLVKTTVLMSDDDTEPDTLEVTFQTFPMAADPPHCEDCDKPLSDCIAVSTRTIPYDYNSAVTVCLSCFDALNYQLPD